MTDRVLKGPEPKTAQGVIVLLHGRGASPADILTVYDRLDLADWAAVAPAAPDHTWYPYSFMAPLEDNQPALDAALHQVDAVVTDLLQQGIPMHRIALLGFSQGACLAVEYALRNPRRYASILALTGAYIGPPELVRSDPGDVAGTPVFLGANDPDPHVPFSRVQETAALLHSMQATLHLRRYPGLPHAINDDERRICRALLNQETPS